MVQMLSASLFHPFSARKKPKDGANELAVVKAAAWAWFQRRSGSEGKPICEFGVTRTRRSPRPSRYKLEAVRKMEEDGDVEGVESGTPNLIQSGNSLLDNYDIESISKQLDCLIESRGNGFHGKFFDASDRQMSPSYDVDSGGNGATKLKKKKKEEKKKKSFISFWPRRGVTCGSAEDVDTRALVNGRPPGKVFR